MQVPAPFTPKNLETLFFPWTHPCSITFQIPFNEARHASTSQRQPTVLGALYFICTHPEVLYGNHNLTGLNVEQQQAVLALDQAVRVKAGPGSGKTRVVIEKVAYLIQNGVLPENILVITFTNKAAKELKERLKKNNTAFADTVRAGTFHSICSSILR
eukprot:gene27437-4738_t